VALPQRMVLSAFAGMGAATCCHPLDVMRVQVNLTLTLASLSSLKWKVESVVFRQPTTNGLRLGLYQP
jgi:hypothetical protein